MYQIFVVEDELLIRQNIRNMVENMAGPYAFCGEASDGEMALSMMQDLMPDILLTDIKMPFLDGFELIQHVKAMMPWLKIIIISGYDEFASAQKAIALGVDLYLLKPVRQADIEEAIGKMARQLEESRAKTELPPGYDKNELHRALHQHFMQQLLYGGADTAYLLEKARALGLDVVHPLYQAVLFFFDREGAGRDALYARMAAVLSEQNLSLYYFNGADQLALVLCGADKELLSGEVYRLVTIIRHELDPETVVTTVVGHAVERLSAVKDTYGTADAMLKRVHSMATGQVIDAGDTAQITADIVSFSGTLGAAFAEKLRYAAPGDIPALLQAYWNGTEGEQYNSMLYRYYTLVEILKTAVHMVSAVWPDVDPKDIAASFSGEHDIFIASEQRAKFEETALALLQKAVRIKQENLGIPRHNHVISQAEAYVKAHYCTPNISLISVAKHVGMSSAHFSTIFSQTMGKTFISYLTALRIEKAKDLLTRTDMKLSAIAMEIGYNEPNYFSHVFKKTEGITPKEFRNKFVAAP